VGLERPLLITLHCDLRPFPAPSFSLESRKEGQGGLLSLAPSPTSASPEWAPKFFEFNLLPISPTGLIFCADFRLSPLMFSIFYGWQGRGEG
jgi:hypothetical protein